MVGIGVVVLVLIFATLFLLSTNKNTETQTAVTNTENQEKTNESSALSNLLEEDVTPVQEQPKSKNSLLSRLLGQKPKATSQPQEVQSVDVYYTVEPGATASIAKFYISSISTPVQGAQFFVRYSDSITPTSIEATIRYPDLIKTEINEQERTLFSMASIGTEGTAVTGAHPVFTVIFTGENPEFTIDTDKTIVASEGKPIPFNIVPVPK